MLTLAVAFLVGSAWLTAVTVMPPAGMVAGAAYRPLAEMVPLDGSPPLTLLTCQVTAVLAVPLTVAVNCCVAPVFTVADVGLMLTAIVCGAPVTVTVAVPDRSELAALTAETLPLKQARQPVPGKGRLR